MIEIRNIAKSYGGKEVLRNISLTLPENRISAFIGSNGAGKSTLLSIISRLLPQSGGEVRIDGKPVGDWDSRELAKRLAVLRQSNFMDIRLTVGELVAFGRFPYSQGRLNEEDGRMVEKALSYLDITDIRDRFLDELSGGQRQMAFIAMVIAQDTRYVLLDEPLNNLDIRHSVHMMKVLRKLVDEMGKTVILVIHDINFVSCYADHIVALRDGELVGAGGRGDIITPRVLENIYGLDIDIREIDGNRICVYYA
ncbi:MAG: ATP-binding cassette domain-containing protein [Planctomycetota bacterium]|jgi:iron complex transport system ATP-binding protein|nr:ATP-binding cassette domain-containing protein [Planctomycetota bacterium]